MLANAKELADQLMLRGMKLVTNGTDNHLLRIDVVTSLGIDGNEAEHVLDSVGLTLNKNVIPDDPQGAFRPSGIRLGTPAMTTRGASVADMPMLAGWIVTALQKRSDSTTLEQVKQEVTSYAESLPLPG